MTFEQLSWATRIFHKQYPYFLWVQEWAEKREHLAVYILDLPHLVQEYKDSGCYPYEVDPRITVVDQIPRIRLASACEAAANCLYSLAELSAKFGNKASKSYFPASFNDFRKKIENGDYGTDLIHQLGDLQWYKKVREIRTEWVHHSTIYIGERDGEPIMVIRAYRRPSDKQEFPSQIQTTVPELIDWMKGAVRTVDAFGDYLLANYIVPSFPLDDTFHVPRYDQNGFPIFLPDKRLDMEQITVREYLSRCGIPN